jgi:hypothetical protein
MERQLGIGFIGYGEVGGEEHLPAVREATLAIPSSGQDPVATSGPLRRVGPVPATRCAMARPSGGGPASGLVPPPA